MSYHDRSDCEYDETSPDEWPKGLVAFRPAPVLDRGRDVTVDTIDSFQGSEKVAIVISLVRSNADGDTGFLGRPLDGLRRLNVAMTRSQRFCAIVGDWYTLRSEPDDTDVDLYDELYSFLENTGRLQQVEPEFIPVPQ